jgi:hypothetical protein
MFGITHEIALFYFPQLAETTIGQDVDLEVLEIFHFVFVQQDLILAIDETFWHRSVEYQDAATVL